MVLDLDSNGVFERYAEIYELIYGEKDSLAETQWVLRRLESAGLKKSSAVLELGAGTGRHAGLIADSGHAVVASEPSSLMLARAQRHKRVQYVHSASDTLRLQETFDAVLALFHVLSYHTSAPSINAFFATASQHLNPGGLLGFDVWFSPAVHALEPEVRVLERANDQLAITRIANPEEDLEQSIVNVMYEFSVRERETGMEYSFRESHRMRHFTSTEIASLATAHGFEILEQVEFLTGNRPSRNTWGVWFTLRKS